MAIGSNNVISLDDIINGYITNVYNPIINGAYHSGNIPTESIYNCIEPERLGNLSNLSSTINKTLNNVGTKGGTITASALANMMIECTRLLTRVGTWSYVRTYRTSNSRYKTYEYDDEGDESCYGHFEWHEKSDTTSTVSSKSGKALFSDEYIKTLARTPNYKPASGAVITASTLNSFFADLLSVWNSTSKYRNSVVINSCHSVCYNACYSDCHDDSCYK